MGLGGLIAEILEWTGIAPGGGPTRVPEDPGERRRFKRKERLLLSVLAIALSIALFFAFRSKLA